MDDNLLIETVYRLGLSFPIMLPIIATEEEQLYLKVVAWLNQEGKCLCEGEPYELHHALISRKDVMGLDNFAIIHDSRNVLLLCQDCHRRITRKQSYRKLCDIFGSQVIEDWYNSVNFRSTFRNLPDNL